MKTPLIFLALLYPASLSAGPRGSTSYTVVTDSLDAVGARSASVSYASDSSGGGVSGIATAGSPATSLKGGYIGQLSEVVAVQLAATPTTLNEGTSRQIFATALLDDVTTTALLGSDLVWSVLSGPVSGVSSSGLATAANVYQDTAATVQGSYRSVSGTLGLTIVNVGTDDLGIYAGDGIPDTWQAQYFGTNNPLGTATADASGTGQTNLLKYTAGLDPLDPASRLLTQVGGSGASHTIIINPRLPDRTYTVQFSTNLGVGGWQELTGATIEDNGSIRTVTDLDAASTRKFYRVQISFP